MGNEAVVLRGRLGWGNRKGGLEAYGPDGRWGGQGAYAEAGDLLGDALAREGATEGSTLIVVAVPRFYGAPQGEGAAVAADQAVERVEAAVRSALRPGRAG